MKGKTLRNNMKIEFTQKQYEALLKIVYLGSWMASSTKDKPEGGMRT
jgi:hypothetical protein